MAEKNQQEIEEIDACAVPHFVFQKKNKPGC